MIPPFTSSPIIVPYPVDRGMTELERVDEAAREYSDKEEIREHFRAGARWAQAGNTPEGTLIGWVIGGVTVLWIIAAVCGFIAGVARFEDDRPWSFDRPAAYIFWPAIPAYKAGDWLFHARIQK